MFQLKGEIAKVTLLMVFVQMDVFISRIDNTSRVSERLHSNRIWPPFQSYVRGLILQKMNYKTVSTTIPRINSLPYSPCTMMNAENKNLFFVYNFNEIG